MFKIVLDHLYAKYASRQIFDSRPKFATHRRFIIIRFDTGVLGRFC